ncbi:MAG: hypothetical protein SFY81_09660 [Verrucomicrobiota bacterium]|nr:hypothetical protein [Verrucomicrobiota bacterium]
MSKLSKDKKDKLLIIIVSALGLMAVLYFFVISSQNAKITEYQSKISTLQDRHEKAKRLLKTAAVIDEELQTIQKELDQHQKDMAPPGQYYIWFFRLLDSFRKNYNVQIVDMTQPTFSDAGLLPKFPYKTAVFGVRLNAPFHDFGKFLADFENAYPYMRVQDLRILPMSRQVGSFMGTGTNSAPAQMPAGNVSEKLNIELKVVTLIKPTTS